MDNTFNNVFIVNRVAQGLALTPPQAQAVLYAYETGTVCRYSARVLTGLNDTQLLNRRVLSKPLQIGWIERCGSYRGPDAGAGRPLEIYRVESDVRRDVGEALAHALKAEVNAEDQLRALSALHDKALIA